MGSVAIDNRYFALFALITRHFVDDFLNHDLLLLIGLRKRLSEEYFNLSFHVQWIKQAATQNFWLPYVLSSFLQNFGTDSESHEAPAMTPDDIVPKKQGIFCASPRQ